MDTKENKCDKITQDAICFDTLSWGMDFYSDPPRVNEEGYGGCSPQYFASGTWCVLSSGLVAWNS